MKVIIVVGARPNFMKIAPLIHAIDGYNGQVPAGKSGIEYVLVHTGQHYDAGMSDVFFRDLGLPKPHVNLEVGSASHAVQTANIMIRFEEVCMQESPDWLIVVGDVNSTMACTLVASKLGIRIGHIEAGLRSFDRTMPEEINRVVTDALADLLFTPSADAEINLLKEGACAEKIKFVGNIMIDSLVAQLQKARELGVCGQFGLKEKVYALVTLHRPSNIDDDKSLLGIMEALTSISNLLPVLFPVHPRTRKQLANLGESHRFGACDRMQLVSPLGYHDFMSLVDSARLVITDSGGLQEETTYLGVPCLTLRPNTERPVTVTLGTNKLTSVKSMEREVVQILEGKWKKNRIPPLWDGKTGERIVSIMADFV